MAYNLVASMDQLDEAVGSLDQARLLVGSANMAKPDTARIARALGARNKMLYRDYCERGQTPNPDSLRNNAIVFEINKVFRATRAFGHLLGDKKV